MQDDPCTYGLNMLFSTLTTLSSLVGFCGVQRGLDLLRYKPCSPALILDEGLVRRMGKIRLLSEFWRVETWHRFALTRAIIVG